MAIDSGSSQRSEGTSTGHQDGAGVNIVPLIERSSCAYASGAPAAALEVPPPGFIAPMLASTGPAAIEADWAHEVKSDG
jgi:hypothetical protein